MYNSGSWCSSERERSLKGKGRGFDSPHQHDKEVTMTVKEVADAFGLTTKQFFRNAYDRYGLLYSIGSPEVTHARYERYGVIPIYVARYQKDMERLLLQHHRSQP